MATTSLETPKRKVNAAPLAAGAGAPIEKRAELHVVAGQAAGRPSLVGLTREEL